MVFNVHDSEVTRVQEKHMSPYFECESPVCYCRKDMCKVFFNVDQRSGTRARDQNK